MKRRLIILFVVAVIGSVVYSYTKADASNRVKQEMLKAADLLDVSPADTAYVRGIIAAAHPAAFNKALRSTKNVGSKFDAPLYVEEVKRAVIEQVNAAGRHELADHLTQEFANIRLDVAER